MFVSVCLLPTQKGYHCAAEFPLCGRAMPEHQFKIGQTVFVEISFNLPGGAHVITKKIAGARP